MRCHFCEKQLSRKNLTYFTKRYKYGGQELIPICTTCERNIEQIKKLRG